MGCSKPGSFSKTTLDGISGDERVAAFRPGKSIFAGELWGTTGAAAHAAPPGHTVLAEGLGGALGAGERNAIREITLRFSEVFA